MTRSGLPPLPVRDGLGPARVRLHGGLVAAELSTRFEERARTKVLAGEVVCADGALVDETTVLPAGSSVYLYRDLPVEVPVPFDIPMLHRDNNIVVVDKPELSPAHRLDRLTAGVLLFTTRRELRGTYQTLFARGAVCKTYLARTARVSTVALPTVVRSRIIKRRGCLQALEESGEPNAETLVEPVSSGLYRLTPRTGRTHQLRVHMASLGLPIDGDPLYPNVVEVARDDFSTPLQLLAQTLEFDDPITGLRQRFISRYCE